MIYQVYFEPIRHFGQEQYLSIQADSMLAAIEKVKLRYKAARIIRVLPIEAPSSVIFIDFKKRQKYIPS